MTSSKAAHFKIPWVTDATFTPSIPVFLLFHLACVEVRRPSYTCFWASDCLSYFNLGSACASITNSVWSSSPKQRRLQEVQPGPGNSVATAPDSCREKVLVVPSSPMVPPKPTQLIVFGFVFCRMGLSGRERNGDHHLFRCGNLTMFGYRRISRSGAKLRQARLIITDDFRDRCQGSQVWAGARAGVYPGRSADVIERLCCSVYKS